MKKTKPKIIKISGPLVVAEGMGDVKMFDVVRVSSEKLLGEVIELRGDRASIQVYEDTSMLGPGEEVFKTGLPLSATLAPGLLGGIFDGIGRPLQVLQEKYGDRIGRGVEISSLDTKKKWNFAATKKIGDVVTAGDILGTVQENEVIEHRIMVPFGLEGKITAIQKGNYTIEETIATIQNEKG
ncbi:MAG: V-type ATP synthase subunit A, partial [Firmicutes bacterium]|nr:V-type ATP synthase subunit A [Bacillota bacterium]